MSRIGKKAIKLPKNVNINYKKTIFSVKGNFGILIIKIPTIFNLKFEKNILYLFVNIPFEVEIIAIPKPSRTLISNMIIGVSSNPGLLIRSILSMTDLQDLSIYFNEINKYGYPFSLYNSKFLIKPSSFKIEAIAFDIFVLGIFTI
jgi:hypothetical protein